MISIKGEVKSRLALVLSSFSSKTVLGFWLFTTNLCLWLSDISQETALHPSDVVSTLQYLGILKYWKGKHVILRATVSHHDLKFKFMQIYALLLIYANVCWYTLPHVWTLHMHSIEKPELKCMGVFSLPLISCPLPFSLNESVILTKLLSLWNKSVKRETCGKMTTQPSLVKPFLVESLKVKIK